MAHIEKHPFLMKMIAVTIGLAALTAVTAFFQVAHADINNPHSTPPSNSITNAMLKSNIIAPGNIQQGNSFQFYGGAYPSLQGDTIQATSSLQAPASTTFNGVGYQWPSSQGAANSTFTNDGSGNLSWAVTSTGVLSSSFHFLQAVSKGQPVAINPGMPLIDQTVTHGDNSTANVTINIPVNNASTTVICGTAEGLGNGSITTPTLYGNNLTNAAKTTDGTYADFAGVWYVNATTTGTLPILWNGLRTGAGSDNGIACMGYIGTLAPSTFDASSTAQSGGSSSLALSPTSTADYDVAVASCSARNSVNYSISRMHAVQQNGGAGIYETSLVGNIHPAGAFPVACAAGSSNPVSGAIALFKSASVVGMQLASSASTTLASFIGIANKAESVGTNGSVDTYGLSTATTTLSSSQTYYLGDTAGTMQTTPGTVSTRVGIAASSTALLITH